jgi:hypothetical protein
MPTIAFTYDLSTAIGQARMYAGDMDPDGLNRTGGDRTRTDDELAFLLSQNGNDARLAAAALLESKAAEFASLAASIKQGTLSQDYRERSWQMRQSANQLRAIAGGVAFNQASGSAPFTVGDGGTMENW